MINLQRVLEFFSTWKMMLHLKSVFQIFYWNKVRLTIHEAIYSSEEREFKNHRDKCLICPLSHFFHCDGHHQGPTWWAFCMCSLKSVSPCHTGALSGLRCWDSGPAKALGMRLSGQGSHLFLQLRPPPRVYYKGSLRLPLQFCHGLASYGT